MPGSIEGEPVLASCHPPPRWPSRGILQAGAGRRPRGGVRGSEATGALSMWPICEAQMGGGGGAGEGILLTFCVLNQFNGSFRCLRFDFSFSVLQLSA